MPGSFPLTEPFTSRPNHSWPICTSPPTHSFHRFRMCEGLFSILAESELSELITDGQKQSRAAEEVMFSPVRSAQNRTEPVLLLSALHHRDFSPRLNRLSLCFFPAWDKAFQGHSQVPKMLLLFCESLASAQTWLEPLER